MNQHQLQSWLLQNVQILWKNANFLAISTTASNWISTLTNGKNYLVSHIFLKSDFSIQNGINPKVETNDEISLNYFVKHEVIMSSGVSISTFRICSISLDYLSSSCFNWAINNAKVPYNVRVKHFVLTEPDKIVTLDLKLNHIRLSHLCSGYIRRIVIRRAM